MTNINPPSRHQACRIVAETYFRHLKESRVEPAVHTVFTNALLEIREGADKVRALYQGLIESAMLSSDFLEAFDREIEELAPEELYPK